MLDVIITNFEAILTPLADNKKMYRYFHRSKLSNFVILYESQVAL